MEPRAGFEPAMFVFRLTRTAQSATVLTGRAIYVYGVNGCVRNPLTNH